MSILTTNDKRLLEDIFEMESGYVLDFTNASFSSFIIDCVNINIYEDDNYTEYCSKANKLRQIWNYESDYVVITLTLELLEYSENYYLKKGKVSKYINNSISKLRSKLTLIIENANRANLPQLENETLSILKKDIDKYLSDSTPELALDRLHTYSLKYLQILCESHSINIYDNKGHKLPLHSLVGMLSKTYADKGLIESDFSLQSLKVCISLFERFNNVRNTHSYAHINPVLQQTEAEFVVKTMMDILTFIDSLENNINK